MEDDQHFQKPIALILKQLKRDRVATQEIKADLKKKKKDCVEEDINKNEKEPAAEDNSKNKKKGKEVKLSKDVSDDENGGECESDDVSEKEMQEAAPLIQGGKVKKQYVKEKNVKKEVKADEAAKMRIYKTPSLRIRTSPSTVFHLIDTLSDQQKKAVRDIGFGGLLKLTLKENQLELINFLLINFNYSQCSVEMPGGGKLFIREEDVVYVFDLPQGKNVVSECHALKGNVEFDRLVTQFRGRWNVENGSPLLKVMAEGLVEREDFGDDFNRDFVVLAVSSVIKSNQDRNVNYRFLDSLHDVNEIRNFNWCSYVIKQLLATVHEWRTSKAVNPWFTGPAAFLMLCYLDRVEFLQTDIKRTFPVCSNWKSVDVSRRLHFERTTGGFGNGIVLNCLPKPLIRQDSNPTTIKLKNVFEKMTTAVVEFKDVMDDIGKEPFKVEGILKIPYDGCYSSSQEGKNGDETDIIKAPTVVTDNPQYLDIMSDEVLFGDPDLAAAIFEFWDVCSLPKEERERELEKWKKRQMEKEMENLKNAKEKEMEKVKEKEEIEKVNEKGKKMENVKEKEKMVYDSIIAIPGPSFDLGIPGLHDEIKKIKVDSESESECEGYTPIEEDRFKRLIDESDEETNDVMKRQNDRSFENLPFKLRSPFWRNKSKILNGKVTQKEQLISDYAFGKMNSKNSRQILRSVEEPKRLFFSTTAYSLIDMDLTSGRRSIMKFVNRIDSELRDLGNLSIEGANLVFFPVLRNNHFWLLCIDYIQSQVFVIDNRPIGQHVKFEKHYENRPQEIKNSFHEYLVMKNLNSMARMKDFPVSVMKMPWRSSKNDCGVYCMRHMETYKGSMNWDCGFVKDKDADLVDTLRVKYCASILMMPMNDRKDEVLRNAKLRTLIRGS
ncbi:hypothetical protein CASFOL_001804 [Castilleja foliolosa]|uniref:Ubiquitin-like protease family profile domain-containing protein n=2 Tax=Castilleja foliolosa TaxID=1961234 RepID=A0ABD3ECF9_9LAMI